MNKIYPIAISVLMTVFAGAQDLDFTHTENGTAKHTAGTEIQISKQILTYTDSKTVSTAQREFPYTNFLQLSETKLGSIALADSLIGRQSGSYRAVGTETESVPMSDPALNRNSLTQNPEQQMTVKDRYWLQIITPGNILLMTAVVYFEGGNDGYWLDDTEIIGGSDEFYTLVDGHKLAIQGKEPFRDYDRIRLGYRAFHNGIHMISIYNKEGVFSNGQDIYLVDKLLNKVVNLSERTYKFVTRKGDHPDRFLVIYDPDSYNGSIGISSGIRFSKKAGRIEISSDNGRITEAAVFDINGKQLYQNSAVGSDRHSISIRKDYGRIIILNVKTENGEVVSKKFIN